MQHVVEVECRIPVSREELPFVLLAPGLVGGQTLGPVVRHRAEPAAHDQVHGDRRLVEHLVLVGHLRVAARAQPLAGDASAHHADRDVGNRAGRHVGRGPEAGRKGHRDLQADPGRDAVDRALTERRAGVEPFGHAAAESLVALQRSRHLGAAGQHLRHDVEDPMHRLRGDAGGARVRRPVLDVVDGLLLFAQQPVLDLRAEQLIDRPGHRARYRRGRVAQQQRGVVERRGQARDRRLPHASEPPGLHRLRVERVHPRPVERVLGRHRVEVEEAHFVFGCWVTGRAAGDTTPRTVRASTRSNAGRSCGVAGAGADVGNGGADALGIAGGSG